MVINHNLMAMNANRQFNIVTGVKAKNVEKMSSGYRINRSADDAAGLAISEKMRRQIRGLTQASKNVQDGISFCQVADGALNEVDDMIHRVNELAIKSANGTNSDEDRLYINEEVQQIKSELTRVFETTEFNGVKIFKVPYTPSIEGHANDFVTFNKNSSGVAGGMILNGERLTWGELGFDKSKLYDDGFGTYRFKENTTIRKQLDGGEILELQGLKDMPLESISRVYRWSADNDGIIVNDNSSEKISWSQVKNVITNQAINPSDVEQGVYKFNYHGMAISFETEASDRTLESVISAINGGGATRTASWYTVQSDAKSARTISLTYPNPSNESVAMNSDIAEMMLDTGLRVYANEDGVGLSSDNHPYTDYTFKTWDELGIKDWGVSDTASGDTVEKGKSYRYAELNFTGGLMSYQFNIEEGASKESVIKALNQINISKSLQVTQRSSSTDFPEASDGTVFSLLDRYWDFDFWNALKEIPGFSDANTYKLDLSVDAVNDHDINSDYDITMSMSVDGGKTAVWKGTITKADYSGVEGSYILKELTLANESELLAGVTTQQQIEKIKGTSSERSQKVYFNLDNTNWGNDYTTSLTYTASSPTAYLSFAAGGERTTNPIYSQIVNPPTKVLDIQAGSEGNIDNKISMEWSPLNLNIIGMMGTAVDTEESSLMSIGATKQAMKIVNKDRMLFGAYQNRLEHTVKNLDNVVENTTAAESAIRDTDMAKASVELSKHNILQQVGQSILAQANQIRSNIISLLS